MTVAEPGCRVTESELVGFGGGRGLVGVFLANLMSAFVAYERCGVHLYRKAAGSTQIPLFTGEGAIVATAQSGAEGLKLAEQNQFDLVISDISMPGMDGYEFLENLRTKPVYARTPAIAVTGFGRFSGADRARRAGYSTLVTKPVDFANLVRLARVVLDK